MASDENIRDAFRWQRDFCAANGGPITARVCDALAQGLDHDSATGRRVLGWEGGAVADALPLRLVAPFHALYRARQCDALNGLFEGEDVDGVAAIRAAIAEHDAEIVAWVDGPPQTNEPGRSAAFVAALLVLGRRFGLPFELLEIGSSAGLNLLIDSYRYTLGGLEVGRATSPVHIAPEWRGEPPPYAIIEIASARGVDIAPIDLATDAARERLLAYAWVDHVERLTRLEAAIELWRTEPPLLEQGDAADWVDARLAEPQADGTTRVLMHSVVWTYLGAARQARIKAAMAAAGARATVDRPLAWVSFERDFGDKSLSAHEVWLQSWPGGLRKRLATGHPHGFWFEWSGEKLA